MKKFTFLIILLGLLLLNSCSPKNNRIKGAMTTPKLALLWETDSILTTVESVVYDEINNLIYCSNIEGKPANKDRIGSISQINLQGKIINRDWISGLNAPKGMGIYNGKLYVTDIDILHEISIKNGEILHSFEVPGAGFLNDVAISKDGTVYFSDTDKGKIFQLKNESISVFMEFDSPNGLLVKKDYLWAVSWGNKTFNKIDIKTKKIQLVCSDIHNPDGIEAINEEEYFVSSWNGMVHKIGRNGTKIKLLDTKKEKIFAADIDYIKSKRILLVPSFFHNTIMAYKYSK